MKKIIKTLGLITILVSQHINAQQEINFGDFSKPVPSVSSLATYANTPISNATGLPDISFPLFGLPTYNSGLTLNAGLSYNPMNVSESEPASQVGSGWSLFAGAVISRSIEYDIDEMYDDASRPYYYKNGFDDIYYYNLPGISGKFKFKRNLDTNTFELVNLSSNKIKIEYTRTSNTATLILESFTITDVKGIKYFFNDYSRSNRQQQLESTGGKLYKSAFFLTQIKDSNNVELAQFSYQKDTRYKNNNTTVLYETCKLKTISSPGFGKIGFEYLYNSSKENTMNDPYQIQKVTLKDNYNHLISGYSFEYTGSKRTLTKLNKLDKNETVSETTEFEYGDYSAAVPSYGMTPAALCDQWWYTAPPPPVQRILKKVITPTKGVVEYTFEYNQFYKDRSEPNYVNSILSGDRFIDPVVQYINTFRELQYNTKQATNYTFTIAGTQTKKVYLVFGVDELFPAPPYWDPNTPTTVGYVIKNNEGFIYGNVCGSSQYSATEYDLSPGSYTFMVTGSGGRGLAQFFGIEHIAQPFPNTVTGGGIRIANIKYYQNKTETTPVKITKYEYNTFEDAQTSSGVLFSPESDSNADSYPLYKNVKITDAADNNNGHIRYYYKNPNDYPKNGNYWPYYSLTSGGLLDKKEVYNTQNKLLVSEQNSYTFEEIPGAQDYPLWSNNNLTSKTAWLKKSSVISTSYFDNNQSIEEQSETNFNVFNFDVASTKKVVDGNTIEQFYTYPETGYTNLSNAHIMNTPVIVEEKNDGKTVSKAETKFTNPISTLPTAVMTSNIGNTTQKTATIDLYDEKGNAIQFTSPAGISTTVIYGYDKTQPIAKIEGATYAQVSPYIQAIVDASIADAQNPDNESALLTALDNFRKTAALKDFQITTITYDPLIGMTTTTPPDGIRAIYKYDASNRLQKIVDMNGVTLKEYQYNYKN